MTLTPTPTITGETSDARVRSTVNLGSAPYAMGSVLLILALALAVGVAWSRPGAQGYYDLNRANTLLHEARFTEATALLERTLLTYNTPQTRIALSQAYLARRDPERAERQARLALQTAVAPLQPAAWSQLGRVLAYQGRDEEALDAFSRARQSAEQIGTDMALHEGRSAAWHIAAIHWKQGRFDQARALLEALAGGDDVYARDAIVRLAQLLAPTGQSRTQAILESISTSEPTEHDRDRMATPDLLVPGLPEGLRADTRDRIVASLREAGRRAEQLEAASASQAERDTLWGGTYLQQGENTLARQYLERAIAADPNYEPAHARLALALLNLGDTPAALQHIDAALRLDPRDPLPHNVLARLYMQQGDAARADEELRALDDLQPGSVEAHLLRAEYYKLLGEYDPAEDEYIEAARLQLSGAEAPSGTNAPLTLARFYTDVRGFGCEKGLPAARQAVTLRPDDPASLDAVGWALVLCGQPDDALSSLNEAVRRSPTESRYRFHLARAYRDLGRLDEARAQYTRVLDLDPQGALERLATNDLVKLPR
jgi:tetratricopeptide (TPR) repeat protein